MAVALTNVQNYAFDCVRVTYHPTYSEAHSCRIVRATVLALLVDDKEFDLFSGRTPRFVVNLPGECGTKVVPPDGDGGPGVVWVLRSQARIEPDDWNDAVTRACVRARESWERKNPPKRELGGE